MVVIFIKTKLFFKRFRLSSPFYQSLPLVPEVFCWRAVECIGLTHLARKQPMNVLNPIKVYTESGKGSLFYRDLHSLH